jgi:thiamine-phosphate pyrophosphorylase
MPLNLQPPITYLITSGKMQSTTIRASKEFNQLLSLIESAVAAGINLIQIREKELPARVLYELAWRAAALTSKSGTRILLNDRADIAAAAGAAGVHLTSRSIASTVIRKHFGDQFLVGVSTHSLAEVRQARDGQADFAVFGPVFETTSKQGYGPPTGLEALREVAHNVSPFPVLALGGVAFENLKDCLRAGAAGIAGIGLFERTDDLEKIAGLVGSMRPRHE